MRQSAYVRIQHALCTGFGFVSAETKITDLITCKPFVWIGYLMSGWNAM